MAPAVASRAAAPGTRRPVAAPPMKRKIRICLWLPADLHEQLRIAAERDDRTMAGYAIVALRRALARSDPRRGAKKPR